MRRFGSVDLPDLCERLAEAGFLHRSGDNWHWVQESYPADTISLRSVTSDNFIIIDITGGDAGKPEVIGEVDFTSALTTVHPKAIYIHQGQQYHVDRLDFDQRKAYVKRVNVDYYTDAIRYTQVRVLEIAGRTELAGPAARAPMATCWYAPKWSASRRSSFSPTRTSARASLSCPKTKCTRPRSG